MFIQPAKQHTTKPFIPRLCCQASIDELQKSPRNYKGTGGKKTPNNSLSGKYRLKNLGLEEKSAQKPS